MVASATLFIIAAPSGAGKTSLVKGLLASLDALEVSVSYTTRPPRQGEHAGLDYHFVDDAAFRQLIERNDLLEYAQVLNHDYFYGTSRERVMSRLAAGVDVILEIDWQGARQVRAAFPDCVSVFILPPSKGALEQRLKLRGQDSDSVIARRMDEAVSEMSHYREFDYLLINDQFDDALRALQAIFIARRRLTSIEALRQRELLDFLLS